MKKLIKESGLRNIKDLSKRYQKAKIYFHQDLDGVTTALAMKNYLENNGIKVVDSEIIQYGDKEFAVKKQDAKGDTMPVLVDFAHGKPMFVVHTDHHDSQTGVEGDTSTSFRSSRSNVETLSQIMSPSDIFTADDIRLISTVDSADFAKYGLEPQDIMNFVFKLQKDKSLQKNKMALGLATNKLMLAYKNKPGFMEDLVMTSQPSLLNIFQNINRLAAEKGYALPEEMALNQKDYVQKQKDSDKVYVDDGIIVQYGGGSMFKPGSYDRYTPFKNNPEADFIVIAWPMGLVQASCNPFKGERELKGVNLGDIAQEVLSKWESQLREKIIPLSTIKWISEGNKQFGDESVGFTNADLEAFYGDKVRSMSGGDDYMEKLKDIMDKPSTKLTEDEWAILDKLGVPAWEMIQANSGGHKCITNISALNYFGRGKRKPEGKYKYNKDKGDSPYVKFVKMIQKEFVRKLKEKINESKGVNEGMIKEIDVTIGDYESDNIDVHRRARKDTVNKELLNDIQSAAEKAKVKVQINWAHTGHSNKTKSGNVSRHSTHDAVDISRLQDLKDPKQKRLRGSGNASNSTNGSENFRIAGNRLKDALVELGYNWNGERGHKKAVLWQTDIGGNHYNHLHVSNKDGGKTNSSGPVGKDEGKIKKSNLKIDDIISNGDNSELIAVGSKGEGVKQIQNILKKNGYDLGEPGVDGKFGPITKKAIKKFQKDRGLNLIDGIVGIETSTELKKG